MAEPFYGEIRMFAGNFAPIGWMFCEGQLLPISGNDALFNLIGTTYGGDGQSTFALPDLRGRLPLHQGQGFVLGEAGGAETITLTSNQIPMHTHSFVATKAIASNTGPGGHVVADSTLAGAKIYAADVGASALAPGAVTPSGGSQPHDNVMPYVTVSFIIAVSGIFPTQS
jgi:microcystin-dependent protein